MLVVGDWMLVAGHWLLAFSHVQSCLLIFETALDDVIL